MPGETHDYAPDPSDDAPNGLIKMEDLLRSYTRARLVGSCVDSLGDQHPINETFDLEEFWRLSIGAQHLMPRDYTKESASHLERMERHMNTIEQYMRKQ